MDQNERKKLEEGLELFLDEGLERLLLSHPTEPSGCSRSRIRPLLLKAVSYTHLTLPTICSV